MSLQLFWVVVVLVCQKVVVILVCKRSSSDLVRHEPNSIEMRCDGGLIWFHLDTFRLRRNTRCPCNCFGVAAVLICKEWWLSSFATGGSCSGLQKVIE
jgi:hypothetical protein